MTSVQVVEIPSNELKICLPRIQREFSGSKRVDSIWFSSSQPKKESKSPEERVMNYLKEIEQLAEAGKFDVLRQRAKLMLNEVTKTNNRSELTSLPNKRALAKHFDRLLDTQNRVISRGTSDIETKNLGLVFLDIDGFKSINSFFGHANADRLLIRLGEVLQDFCTSNGGNIFHISGDEFLVVIENITSTELLQKAKRLVEFVQNSNVIGTTKLYLKEASPSSALQFHEGDIADTTFSVSAGCAGYEPGLKLDEWITRADSALEFAKISGRNAASEWIPNNLREKYTKHLINKLRSNSQRHSGRHASPWDYIDVKKPDADLLKTEQTVDIELEWKGGGVVGTASLSLKDLDLLIRKGADVNWQHPTTGQTPLHLCLKQLQKTDLEIWEKHCKTLASLPLDVDIRDNSGTTVLNYATELGLEEVALSLAEKRHNPLIPGSSGKLVLDLALDRGFYELARKEMELGAGRKLYTEDAKVIWFDAVQEGSTILVQEFLERGWNPNIFNLSDQTALFKAVYCQNEEMVKLLVTAKGNVNAKDYRNRSVLMDLVGNWGNNRLYFVNMLVELKADPLYEDKKGRTLIHHLVMNKGSPDVINRLIELGVDPLAVDKTGITAIEYAENEIYMNILGQGSCLMC